MKSKRYIPLLLLLLSGLLFAKTWRIVEMGDATLFVLKDKYAEYDSKGITVTFYKQERDKNLHFLFSFLLDDATGGCSDKSLEHGAYEVNGTTLMLYTLWDRKGSVDDAPFGGRIKRYEMTDKGELKEVSSQLYIETHTQGSEPNSGMKFLFEKPISKVQKELLVAYITSVEKHFHGTFVQNEEAKRLMIEVRRALKRQLKRRWKR